MKNYDYLLICPSGKHPKEDGVIAWSAVAACFFR